jgi:hypothetical protein
VQISAETMPIKSELRPPYSTRTATSRPSVSAPRAYLPSALQSCGPRTVTGLMVICPVFGSVTVPPAEMTSTCSPLTVTVSVRCVLFGPVPATCSAYHGAATHAKTMSKKTTSDPSAT